MTARPTPAGWEALGRGLLLAGLGFCWALGSGGASRVQAQETSDVRREIIESQRRLEEIRNERARLQAEMVTLRTQVEDVSSQLRNVERQLSASRSVLTELDFQVDGTTQRIQETSTDLLRTREELVLREAVLARRLRDTYKQGELHTVRVLLSADSFADLLNRYRYLRLIADYDQTILEQVQGLESELMEQDQELRRYLSELERLRQEKVQEVAELRRIEEQHQSALSNFRSQERQTMSRLDQLEQDEERMRGLITDLEARRREEERRRAMAGEAAVGGALSGSDAGSLDWPVEGDLIYRFGRERRPNGTVLRWNGIGIRAEPGTPVRAVAPGTVVLAGPFEGYGPTVVVSHGAGFYTLYLYLEDIGVVEGRRVVAGQVVGTVGGSETPEGPHLEFQIRAPVEGGSPQARDPLQWLRPQGGGDAP
jgi:septal ring factor EnvC (AmiA/AmiB activator)